MRPGDKRSAIVVKDRFGEAKPTHLIWSCESARAHKLVMSGAKKLTKYFPNKKDLLQYVRGEFGVGKVWWNPPLFKKKG